MPQFLIRATGMIISETGGKVNIKNKRPLSNFHSEKIEFFVNSCGIFSHALTQKFVYVILL